MSIKEVKMGEGKVKMVKATKDSPVTVSYSLSGQQLVMNY